MKNIKIKLRSGFYISDVDDIATLYFAFIGHYYQRVQDSIAGFGMLLSYGYTGEAWGVRLHDAEYDEFKAIASNKTFKAYFEWEDDA